MSRPPHRRDLSSQSWHLEAPVLRLIARHQAVVALLDCLTDRAPDAGRVVPERYVATPSSLRPF